MFNVHPVNTVCKMSVLVVQKIFGIAIMQIRLKKSKKFSPPTEKSF